MIKLVIAHAAKRMRVVHPADSGGQRHGDAAEATAKAPKVSPLRYPVDLPSAVAADPNDHAARSTWRAASRPQSTFDELPGCGVGEGMDGTAGPSRAAWLDGGHEHPAATSAERGRRKMSVVRPRVGFQMPLSPLRSERRIHNLPS